MPNGAPRSPPPPLYLYLSIYLSHTLSRTFTRPHTCSITCSSSTYASLPTPNSPVVSGHLLCPRVRNHNVTSVLFVRTTYPGSHPTTSWELEQTVSSRLVKQGKPAHLSSNSHTHARAQTCAHVHKFFPFLVYPSSPRRVSSSWFLFRCRTFLPNRPCNDPRPFAFIIGFPCGRLPDRVPIRKCWSSRRQRLRSRP